MDFDETRLYYSHQALRRNDDVEAEEEQEEDVVQVSAVRRHFREFLSECFSVHNVKLNRSPSLTCIVFQYRKLSSGAESLHLS